MSWKLIVLFHRNIDYCSRSSVTALYTPEDDRSIWSKHPKLSSHQVDSRKTSNLSSVIVFIMPQCACAAKHMGYIITLFVRVCVCSEHIRFFFRGL